MRPLLLLSLWMLACTSTLQAQEPRPLRQWITGKVLHADGSPWAKGEVVLHSHSWRVSPEPSLTDRVVVKSNDRGLFRAAVQPGRVYLAWCQSPVVDGHFTSTDLVTASAGTPVTLTADEHERCVVEFTLQNAAAWRDRGPLRAEAIAFVGCRLQAPCEDLGDGRFRVPALPAATPYLRVTDRAGVVIVSGPMPLRTIRRKRLMARRDEARQRKHPFRIASLTEHRIALPPPLPMDITVVSPTGPVAGAQLTWCDRTEHRLWAVTDGQGKAQLVVPRVWGKGGEGALRYLSFWVSGPGVVTAHAYSFDHPVPRDGSAGQWKLSLPSANVLRGRLLWRDGSPAMRVPLQLHTGAPGGKSFVGISATYGGAPQCSWTDDEGRFAIAGRPGFLGYQLSTFLRENELAQLPRSPLPYSPFVVLSSGVEAAGQDTELGDLTLADYVPVDVTVTAADGQRAAGHAIHFREQLDADMQEERVCYTRVDWQGRIRLLGRPGSILAISVMTSGDSDDIGPAEEIEVVSGQPRKVALQAVSDK